MKNNTNQHDEILTVDQLLKIQASEKYETDIKSVLSEFYNVNVNENLRKIRIPSVQKSIGTYTYELPKRKNLTKYTSSFLCPPLFSTLSLDAFYEVLCNIYTEHLVIFVSEDLDLLTSSM